jgi:hypothetical protein
MSERWFSPATAGGALEQLRPVVERLRDVHRAMQRSRPARPGSDRAVAPAYFDLVVRLHRGIGELARAGVTVRDLAAGRVELPARRAGRAVLLCWQLGEGAIAAWRELDDDAGARRAVDPDGPWDEPPQGSATVAILRR